MNMNIYEVVFWGSKGKADAADTIYLVRAPDFHAAIDEVQRNASWSDHRGNSHWPDTVYEVGVDLSPLTVAGPCVLRGPYFAFAYNHGWKAWSRKISDSVDIDEWEAKVPSIE